HSSSFTSTPPPPTDTSTLSLHDALPICHCARLRSVSRAARQARCGSRASRRQILRGLPCRPGCQDASGARPGRRACRESGKALRSEEHTSELQSLTNLVCRLLLEKKKKS